MPDRDAYSHYKETQIMTASQGKLIVLMYEGAIKFIESAANSLDAKKLDVVNNNLIKAQDIITELAISINFEAGEMANNMYNLYMYFNKNLLEANIKKDKAMMLEVRDMLSSLLEAWKKIADKSGDSPVRSGGVNIAG